MKFLEHLEYYGYLKFYGQMFVEGNVVDLIL